MTTILMVDPQQTAPIPTNNQATPEPVQETDFFGGGEAAFHNGSVINPNDGTEVPTATPTFMEPEAQVRDPIIPVETAESTEKLEEEAKKEALAEGDEPLADSFEPIIESESKQIPATVVQPIGPAINAVATPVAAPVATPVAAPVTTPVVAPVATPVVAPVTTPVAVPVATPVAVPVTTQVMNPIPQIETPKVIEEPATTVQEKEPIKEQSNLSDLGKKFIDLLKLCTQIQEWKKAEEGFELVGANNDKLQILYKFLIGDPEFPMVSVTKTETDKTEEEESTNELNFYLNEAGTSVNVNLNDELLFEEELDLKDDMKKKMQVMEKLNKFIFLVSEEARKIEREIREREAEQEEKRKLQDIFRNF